MRIGQLLLQTCNIRAITPTEEGVDELAVGAAGFAECAYVLEFGDAPAPGDEQSAQGAQGDGKSRWLQEGRGAPDGVRGPETVFAEVQRQVFDLLVARAHGEDACGL